MSRPCAEHFPQRLLHSWQQPGKRNCYHHLATGETGLPAGLASHGYGASSSLHAGLHRPSHFTPVLSMRLGAQLWEGRDCLLWSPAHSLVPSPEQRQLLGTACLDTDMFSADLLLSHSVMSDSLQPRGLQHARLPCPSPSPRACSNSCPFSW